MHISFVFYVDDCVQYDASMSEHLMYLLHAALISYSVNLGLLCRC